jgi:hypothetical protein
MTTKMSNPQWLALARLCKGYKVPFREEDFVPQFDLPPGYVAGWVGPIFVGCSPEGEISS